MKYKILPYIIILITASILVFSWFKEGYILGTAEAIIPFYHLDYITEVSKWAWSEYPGLGNANEIVLAYYPTYHLLSLLEKIKIPGFLIEAGVLWFILVSAGSGVYLLTKELFPKNSWKFNIFATFFYWFNLLSLVNVWNRFLFAYLFFWALLPLALFLFLKGLRLQKIIFAAGVGLLSGIFSVGLASPSFNILLWLLLIYTTLFWMIGRSKESKVFGLKFFIFSLISFVLVNFWWISQVVNYIYFGRYSQDVSNFFNDSVSLSTFNSISSSLGSLIDLFRLMHVAFFNLPIIDWAKFYTSPGVVAVEFLISGIILFHILKNYKNRNILFLGFLFIVAILLMKGSSDPLGQPFQFLFERFSLLHYFRNPFEKFGFLLPLVSAILLSDGLKTLTENLKGRKASVFYGSFFIIFILLFGYPFFSGLVFTSMSPPNNKYDIGFKVKVPGYYKEADQFMQSLGSNFRFAGFPLGDEGITYKWEKGYQGVELSSVLFSSPIILFRTSVPFYDVIVQKMEELLLKSEDFNKIAGYLNVKYLMVRSDIDYQERNMRNPKLINDFLDGKTKNGDIKKTGEFGKLTFWENLKWQDRTVYPENNITYVYPGSRISDLSYAKDSEILVQGEIGNKLKERARAYLIHPKGLPTMEGVSPEDLQLIYSFEVNEEGEYELFLDNLTKYFADLELIIAMLQFSVDDSPEKTLSPTFTNSLGKFNFKKGTHKITFNRIVTQSSLQISELNLNALNNGNELEVNNFDPYSRYLVSLNYLFKNPGRMSFQITHDNDSVRDGKEVSRFTKVLYTGSAFKESQYFFDYYEPNKSANSARMRFQLDPSIDLTEISVTDLKVRKIIDLEPILIMQNKVQDFSLPSVTYTKINPTKYSVQIKDAKNSFSLVLSELFNSGWEAKFEDGTMANDHFLANAYANGWFIEKTGDFNITLEFAPQRLLNVGKLISGVAFIGGVLYIGSSLLKKNKRNNL